MRHLARIFEIKTLFALTLASLLTGSLIQQYLGHDRMSQGNVDFYVYYLSAGVIHDNPRANLYEGATDVSPMLRLEAPDGSALLSRARAVGFDHVLPYIYPPLLADLLVPISRIPVTLAVILWRALNLILVFFSVFLLARMLRIPTLSYEFVVLSFVAYSYFPIHEAVFIGQVTIILLALWTIGIVAYFDDCLFLSAAAFALATALKVTPILLFPLFVIWKDRKWFISYLAILCGLVSAMVAINGLHIVTTYLSVMSVMSDGIPAYTNKSLGSLVAWVFYGKIFTLESAPQVMVNPHYTLSVITKIISGTFYLFCLFLVWRSRHWLNRASKAATIAIYGLIVSVVSPLSWRHAYTVAFIVLVLFWVKALRSSRLRRVHAVLLALMSFTLGTVFVDVAAQSPLPQLCKIILGSFWVVFAVVFSVDVLYHAREDECSIEVTSPAN